MKSPSHLSCHLSCVNSCCHCVPLLCSKRAISPPMASDGGSAATAPSVPITTLFYHPVLIANHSSYLLRGHRHHRNNPHPFIRSSKCTVGCCSYVTIHPTIRTSTPRSDSPVAWPANGRSSSDPAIHPSTTSPSSWPFLTRQETKISPQHSRTPRYNSSSNPFSHTPNKRSDHDRGAVNLLCLIPTTSFSVPQQHFVLADATTPSHEDTKCPKTPFSTGNWQKRERVTFLN
ncbi:hypothetical protein BXZ70DRAFT_513965 [Cristinia sonorae]|uniref:Uncharacterized protein n=1 Tax=Cristinia sonorae TaxID=1940300 RepID=A0A8K0UW20_9AGAR|nr:hypothetical protein BXZ70DRAFT_513965 [Cristinia sonorae]